MVRDIRDRGVALSDQVEAAFLSIARERFITRVLIRKDDRSLWTTELSLATCASEEAWLAAIYQDEPVVVSADDRGVPTSSSTAPWLMAAMLEGLQVRTGQRVLEIGTGTGYNARLLRELVGPDGEVVSFEIDEALARSAEESLRDAGADGIRVVAADGFGVDLGLDRYDRIMVTAGCRTFPRQLLERLAPAGVLLLNLVGYAAGTLLRVEKSSDGKEAIGGFLDVGDVAFIDARNSSRNDAHDVNGFLSGSATEVAQLGEDLWPVAGALETAGAPFRFHLQLALPGLFLGQLRRHRLATHMGPYLLNRSRDGLTWIRRVDGYEGWSVVSYGADDLWPSVVEAYEHWLRLSEPRVEQYGFHAMQDGEAVVRLGRDGRWETWPV
jgi:protein-L-isoaspartate(D-aspartate) O-methyltransferase